LSSEPPADHRATPTRGALIATVTRLSCTYAAGRQDGTSTALRDVDLDLFEGEVVALMGRNGAGKSTLLKALAGWRGPLGGKVAVAGHDPARWPPDVLVRHVGLVPPDPSSLLYEQSVANECAVADKEHRLAAGATRAALDSIQPNVAPDRHPRDLSEGERLSLALAVVLAPAPGLLLLDEPTRGLDYSAKSRLAVVLRELAGSGHSVVLATHDVELVAEVADRAIVLADGEVVSDGVARDVVVHSPVFAPQVAKVLAPGRWLTVNEVRAELAS
jgi:energy-coupling factor transport system ATP-binding protein